MSAITRAHLDNLRAELTVTALAAPAGSDYQAALQKAPALVVAGHLLGVAAHLAALALQVAAGRRTP